MEGAALREVQGEEKNPQDVRGATADGTAPPCFPLSHQSDQYEAGETVPLSSSGRLEEDQFLR